MEFETLFAPLVSSRDACASAPSVMGCNTGKEHTPPSWSPLIAPAPATSPPPSSASSLVPSSTFSCGLSGTSPSPSRLELNGELPLWCPPLLLAWLLLARLRLLLSNVSSPEKVWLKIVGNGRFAPPPSRCIGDLRAPPPPPLENSWPSSLLTLPSERGDRGPSRMCKEALSKDMAPPCMNPSTPPRRGLLMLPLWWW